MKIEEEEVRADEHDTGRNDRSDRCNVGDPVKRKQGRIRDLCKRSGKHCSICAHLRQAWYFRSYCKRTYSILALAVKKEHALEEVNHRDGCTGFIISSHVWQLIVITGICKDAGYQTIAGQIETFAKLTILALGMPVLTALLETVREFLS